jgi:pimeloyl-ACP methyl ester carboxylesterase
MTLDINFVSVGNLDIAYRFDGPNDGPVVVLVTGFGDQLIDWPESLVQTLAESGFRVLRFEPRDSGRSGSNEHWKSHGKLALFAASVRLGPRPDYTLDDLAEELLGVIDALELVHPHLIGYSMGGMIAQRATIIRNFASLTLLFSSSQAPALSRGSLKAAEASVNLTQRKTSHEARVAAGMALIEVTNGDIFRKQEDEARHDIERQVCRAYRPEGVGRMMLALLKSPPAHQNLNKIETPTFVLSAEKDCFFGPDHARDLAARIPNSELREVPGSGHNLPPSLGKLIATLWLEKFGSSK